MYLKDEESVDHCLVSLPVGLFSLAFSPLLTGVSQAHHQWSKMFCVGGLEKKVEKEWRFRSAEDGSLGYLVDYLKGNILSAFRGQRNVLFRSQALLF